MKKLFSEEQIIGILKENEAGVKVRELVRQPACASRPSIAEGPSSVAWMSLKPSD